MNRMQRLIAAGILYLLGISVVLLLKPSLMFTADGNWKEFGIGRNPQTHTFLPFWLFAIAWALVSYILVIVLLAIFGVKEEVINAETSVRVSNSNRRKQSSVPVVMEDMDMDIDDIPAQVPIKSQSRSRGPVKLQDGYYILNADATENAGGVPKYIFLGKGL